MYAIAELIEQELTKRNWRKSGLVAAMGYNVIARGLKRVDHCMQTGDCSNTEMLSRLRSALDLPTEQFNSVIAATRKQCTEEDQARTAQKEVEDRARFRPYVYVRTSESRPSFITAAALVGTRMKYLQLEDGILSLQRPTLLARVTEMVREHYRSNRGECLLFGDITGYALRITYDEMVEFSVDGTVIQECDGWTEDEGHAILTVGKQVIREGLF